MAAPNGGLQRPINTRPNLSDSKARERDAELMGHDKMEAVLRGDVSDLWGQLAAEV